jgi:hypothetical protein
MVSKSSSKRSVVGDADADLEGCDDGTDRCPSEGDGDTGGITGDEEGDMVGREIGTRALAASSFPITVTMIALMPAASATNRIMSSIRQAFFFFLTRSP